MHRVGGVDLLAGVWEKRPGKRTASDLPWHHRVVPEQEWPDDWSDRKAGKDCAICRALAQVDGKDSGDNWVWIHDGGFTRTYLERHSRLPGYCVVVWKNGHVVEPHDLDPDAAAGYWRELLEVGRAIEARFQPVKLNYQMLGNWVPHLHTHVLPRYLDDPAPGGPLPWGSHLSTGLLPETEARAQAQDLRRLLGA